MAYKTLKPVRVPAAIESKYHKKLKALVEKTHKSLLYWLKAEYRKNEKLIADSPTSSMSKELRRLKAYWRKMYGEEAEEIAKWFANQMRRHTAGNLQSQFKNVTKAVGGFDLDFKYMSQKERFVFRAIVESNVNLIKSIGEQYLTQVEGIVLRSIEVGNDLGEMTEQLGSQYDITMRRAAMISRDQTAKANENLSRTRLMDYGVTQARWMHTSSGKTYRESHVDMDGEIYDLNQGCFDPDYGGYIHPAELVNCRCVCVPIIPTGEPVEQGYGAAPGQPEKNNETLPPPQAGTTPLDGELKKLIDVYGAEKKPVTALSKKLSDNAIITRLGKKDPTNGSCASVALAYMGNKNGLDVLDFRGGGSREVFCSKAVPLILAKLDGVKSFIESNISDLASVNLLKSKMDLGKKYYLATGHHAAIVRKMKSGYQYLELQSDDSGWKTLNDKALKGRFRCMFEHVMGGKHYEVESILIECDSLAKRPEFRELLEYINTAE